MTTRLMPPSDSNAGRIERACITCGYALAGLSPEGVCPECGTPVELSLRPDRLIFANPRWLDRVHTGAIMLELAFTLGVARMVLGGIAAAFGAFALPGLINWIAGFVVVSFSALEFIGWFLLTSSEPARANSLSDSARRAWLRCCALAAAALTLGVAVIRVVGPLGGVAGEAILHTCSAIVSIPTALLALGHLEALARRAGFAHLITISRTTRALTWGVLLPRTLLMILGVIAQLFSSVAARGGIIDCFSIPFVLAWFAWAIFFWRLIDGTRAMLSGTRFAIWHSAMRPDPHAPTPSGTPAAPEPAATLGLDTGQPSQERPDPPTSVDTGLR